MRLIDADALLKKLKSEITTHRIHRHRSPDLIYKDYDELVDAITNAPTVKCEVPDYVKSIKIPTDTMEQEFQNYYRRGYEAGKKTVQREGWVSVPIEPTEKMLEAMWKRHKLNDGTDDTYELVVKNNYRLDYKAMIQAAPTGSNEDAIQL